MDTRSFPHPASGWPLRRFRPLLAATALAVTALTTATAQASPAAADSPTGPPPVTVLTPGADNSNGDIFISPFGDTSTYENGPEIIDNQGNVIWFHPVPAGQEAADFRTQTYDGQPVLTWWQGTGLGGLSQGTGCPGSRAAGSRITGDGG